MKKHLLPILFFLSITSIFPLSAQLLSEWVNCTSGLYVYDFVETPSTRWIATSGGLVKENRTTGEQDFYTRGNSPIPSNWVHSIQLDENGLLWLSTNLGVASFDGDQWDLFYDKEGLLETDVNGNVVIAGYDSLFIWNGSTFTSIEKPPNVFFQNSDFVSNQEKEEYWLSYYGFGVFAIDHFDGQEWTRYDYNNSPLPFESTENNPLLLDNNGRLWAGTTSGLYRFENGNWTLLDSQNSAMPEGAISALALTEEGVVLVVQHTRENNQQLSKILEVISDNNINIHDLPEELDGTPILNRLKESDQKEFLIGTKKDGLWAYNQQDWQQLPTSQSFLQSNLISQLFVQDENSWIITGTSHTHENNSLVSYLNGDWKTYDEASIPFDTEDFNSSSQALEYGPDDKLWFYSRNQIYNYKDGLWTTPSLPDVSPTVDENNTLVHFAPDGKRWIFDKWTSFIFQETDQGWITHPHEMHGGVSGTFQNITNHPTTEDLWFSTQNGLSHYDGQQWEIFKFKDFGQTTNQAFDFAIDKDGILYVTAYKDLFRYDGNTFIPITDDNTPIPNFWTRGLAIDNQNRIWIGLANALARLDGTEWTIYDHKNSGIPNGSLNHLEFDAKGNLWIGTSQGGIAFYNPDGVDLDLNDVLHTNTKKPKELINGSLIAYPNPINNGKELNIELPNNFEIGQKIQITLYNSAGQVSWTQQTKISNHKMTIALAKRMASGIYFLKVKNQKISSSVSIFIE